MYKYSSNITFLYYSNLDYGSKFIEEVFKLEMVMNQGFAKVYQINEKSFLGIVRASKDEPYKGNTLISFNTRNLEYEYNRVSKLDISSLKDIQYLEQIPLKSFFFKDNEGHDFEIQQFINEEDIILFG